MTHLKKINIKTDRSLNISIRNIKVMFDKPTQTHIFSF